MKVYYGILLIFVAFSNGNSPQNKRIKNNSVHLPNINSSYKPLENYFLPYLLKLKYEEILKSSRDSNSNQSFFETECKLREYSYSYFHQIVYGCLCSQNETKICSCDSSFCTVTKILIEENLDFFTQTDQSRSPFYQEKLIEDVSFCTSIACPLVNHSNYLQNYTLPFSLYQCMPNWCQYGFFAVLILDILLAFSISFTNAFVLGIGIKNSFHKTPGG